MRDLRASSELSDCALSVAMSEERRMAIDHNRSVCDAGQRTSRSSSKMSMRESPSALREEEEWSCQTAGEMPS
jgi:hypothetical protein